MDNSERERKQWWLIFIDTVRAYKVDGLSYPGTTSWYIPKWGIIVYENVHLFATEQEAYESVLLILTKQHEELTKKLQVVREKLEMKT